MTGLCCVTQIEPCPAPDDSRIISLSRRLQLTRILYPLEHAEPRAGTLWWDYVAIHLEETLAGVPVGTGYLSRAATDYIAMLQSEGRRPALLAGFFVFEDRAMHARMDELVVYSDDATFDHAVDLALSEFKDQAFALMCEVAPAMAALSDCRDFTTISNTYVDVARKLPPGAGVYYDMEPNGFESPFPTVARPTFFNRFNLGLRRRDYPGDDFVAARAEWNAETARRLIEDGRVDMTDEEIEALLENGPKAEAPSI